MKHTEYTDILIVGGGIAGLWLNARLQSLGYSTILLEKNCLGGEQSIKSQGIIHGGTKYALAGALTGSSEAISEMPRRWREALLGSGDLDLRGVGVLSEAHYLWSPGGLASGLTGFFASKAMRGRVDSVSADSLPLALKSTHFRGKAYRLAEIVLDVPSLISKLALLSKGSIYKVNELYPMYAKDALSGFNVDGKVIKASRIVLCAGSGNSELLNLLKIKQPCQQLRPLHMVMVKSAGVLPLYAHCIGTGSKPRITVTTHVAHDGQWVWYLGGGLAEAEGVARNEEEQIKFAKKELSTLLPWISLNDAQWRTIRVNRAEPAQSSLVRPDSSFLHEENGLLVGWPTKLALAPDFADRVLDNLKRNNIFPNFDQIKEIGLPRPLLARPLWESEFV